MVSDLVHRAWQAMADVPSQQRRHLRLRHLQGEAVYPADPARFLAIAIVGTAVLDWQYDPRMRAELRQSVADPWFAALCDIAALDVDYVRREMMQEVRC